MEFGRPLAYHFPLLHGEDVRAVQQALIALRLVPTCGDADGIFGDATRACVRLFQNTFNATLQAGEAMLTVSGVVDAPSWAVLMTRASASGAKASNVMAATAALMGAAAGRAAPPIDEKQAGEVKKFLDRCHRATIDHAIAGLHPALDFDLVCAIAGKESACFWVGHLAGPGKVTDSDIPRLCVFDASGDVPGTARSAFPRNAAELRASPRFGDLADMLIAEANEQRRLLRGFGPKPWLYKGYGLFQYDLQNIVDDETFFRNKLWYDVGASMERFVTEMKRKLKDASGDIHDAVRRYNGSGPKAEQYALDVFKLKEWCAAVPSSGQTAARVPTRRAPT